MFSVVVSKTIIKKAVDRNFVKKRIYSILNNFVLKINKPTIGVVYLKKGCEKLSFNEIKNEIEETFKKARLI